MIYFCYFIFLFLLVRLLIALVNLLTFCYLPDKTSLISSPKVSILVPARNEEQNIGNLLNQLSEFSYMNLEIIIYDDNSTDRTAEIVKNHIINNQKIRLLSGEGLPDGWLGKNYACHCLAEEARGEVLLFLDADVSVKNGLIERSLNHFQKFNLQLLSIFPKQIFKSTGEKISVPLMNWILLSFLPLIFVRILKNAAFSAANGQFMLFNSDTYKRLIPHSLFRKHRVEDIAIISYFKKQDLKTDTLLGDEHIKCRMYNGMFEAIEGFSKNIFQFFGSSIFLTLIVGIITTIAPFIAYIYFGAIAGIIYLSGIVLIRIFVSLASRQSVIENLVFLLPQHLVFLLIISKGIMNYKKKELIWKGRNVL
jgi:glycosyltransferase involved in cell wall biosynthesis